MAKANSTKPPKSKGFKRLRRRGGELEPSTTENKIKEARLNRSAEAQVMSVISGLFFALRPKSMMTAVDEIKPEKNPAMGNPQLRPVSLTAKCPTMPANMIITTTFQMAKGFNEFHVSNA